MDRIKAVRKFLVAAAAVVVAFGILDDQTAQAIVSAVGAVLVYLVPNG